MTEEPAIVPPAAQSGSFRAQSADTRLWWPIIDLGVLGIWIAVVGFTLSYHEKWADEAQAWLIARDLDLKTIWFHELRYEGSPGLWHTVLWVAQHVFHAKYDVLGLIGMVGATAGVAFVLWKAPFPRFLRYMLVFSYFMVYQYAVIARPYTLLPLLTFTAAALFGDLEHPERMTAVLVLLANLSLHGTVIAGCLGLAYFTEAIRSWPEIAGSIRKRYMLCIGAMLVVFLFLFVILKPTPDVEEFVIKKDPTQYNYPAPPAKLDSMEAILSGAFLDFWLPSVIFLLLAGAWCFSRKKLLPFALPVALLIILYTWVHGDTHHHGTAFVIAIAGLWIAWPTDEEKRVFTIGERRATNGMIGLLVCLFGLNIWDASVAIRNDYHYPYSGAEDAANYLKSVGVAGKSIFGYLYGTAAVQAYFDRNILSNLSTTYFHHGTPMNGHIVDAREIRAASPEYILVHSTDNPADAYRVLNAGLRPLGYELVHFSDGYLFFKRSFYSRQTYFIFRRVRQPLQATVEPHK